jgi:lysophospholipase L1-like esterase
MSKNNTSSKKTWLFSAVLWSPLFFLLLFVLCLGFHVWKINAVDYKEMEIALNKYLHSKKGVMSALPKIEPGDTTTRHLFTFGASSVVVTNGKTFSQYLETALSDSATAVLSTNFGVPGYDSYSIRLRVNQVLDSVTVKPDLALLYFGHNDFNNAYDKVLKPYFPTFGLLLKPMHFFYQRQPEFQEGMTYPYYCRLKNPEIINWFQHTGMVTISDPIHTHYDSLILHHFQRNLMAILDRFEQASVPVVLITPIGNLYAPPIGNRETVSRNFKNGTRTQDQLEAYRLLKTAQDNELLTYDIRAKSMLNEVLRNIHRKNVSVLDLENTLLREGFAFDDRHFLDYFHLNDSSHLHMARAIEQHLKLHTTIAFP